MKSSLLLVFFCAYQLQRVALAPVEKSKSNVVGLDFSSANMSLTMKGNSSGNIAVINLKGATVSVFNKAGAGSSVEGANLNKTLLELTNNGIYTGTQMHVVNLEGLNLTVGNQEIKADNTEEDDYFQEMPDESVDTKEAYIAE